MIDENNVYDFAGHSSLRLCLTGRIRNVFLAHLPKEDLLVLRLVCHEFNDQTVGRLFSHININFRSGTFTRPTRTASLERIGKYVNSLTFRIPHSSETFLPPLLDPMSGEERTFIYSPQVYHPSASPHRRSRPPRYGTWEMTDLLIKQYPPLFHAATDVPSFIHAFTAMKSLKHLEISCDGQDAAHRYRRSVVDYALISLRIAIEKAPMESLNTFTLSPIHPGATLYLQPGIGFGVSPSGQKRWAQIVRLTINMDSFPYGIGLPTDHLKLLHTYLQSFPRLTHLAFRWRGEKGPCPLFLTSEPYPRPGASKNSPPPSSKETPTSPSSPCSRPLTFPSLRYMELENIVSAASQLSVFLAKHRQTLSDLDFKETLLGSGTWAEALAPLTRTFNNNKQRREPKPKEVEEMDVPIMLSPDGLKITHLAKAFRDYQYRRNKAKLFKQPTGSSLQRFSARSHYLFGCRPEHMKRAIW